MNQPNKQNEWALLGIAAIICTIIFIFMEIVPAIITINKHEYGGKAIPKTVAEERAGAFAAEQTGLTVVKTHVVHQSDKLLTGYLAKEKQTENYENKYDSQFPVDTFQVNVNFAEGKGHGFVYVHMFNERIVGWNLIVNGTAVSEQETRELTNDFLYESGRLQGHAAGNATVGRYGELTQRIAGYEVEEAQLSIVTKATSIDGKLVLSQYKPTFDVPDAYKNYVKDQDKLAGWLTGVGYGFMTFVLGVLAIIYAILYRKHTSFTYGILLTVVFFIAYVIMNLGVADGMIASQGEVLQDDFLSIILTVTTIVLSVVMAASVYFSLVAGDGLWKSQGRSVWPRMKEPGYGDYVWRSMGLSYLFALIMLGLQPVIFFVLGKLIGTWGASDVTMSPYNMKYLWLMPVLAWAAAISEEAVYRFFGIGLFRRWFRNTFAAAIIPTIIWALGHVMYPFYPSTTRLFELIVIGLIFSFIFVRFGFITAMFTHVIFNSVAVGSSMIFAGGTINIVSALFFIILPVIIAFILKVWSNRKRTNPPTRSTIHPLEQQ
ncbi:CPBP family intramembrane glutamic endopeptidase [Paenibacillus paeoniae]|uniref:CPBP family intramembrane metalloprotease n=1 Tax=Paenibacillus paeoniae TaxID=2292705 RepID=A0A371PFA8_9BACL|nr:CPBP family intramembrane glutamic endopeptidase [Paenibacillus paeoniae]REK74565.1 CPBP family intramembrane metalloprotease [Paenibacillus paeoniae]